MGYAFGKVPNGDVAKMLEINDLQSRRRVHDLIFLFELLNVSIDSAALLEMIQFKVPISGTRIMPPSHVLCLQQHNERMNRTQHLENQVSLFDDFFNCSLCSFRSAVDHHVYY